MELVQIISEWEKLDFETRKYIIKAFKPNLQDNSIINIAKMNWEEIEEFGYSNIVSEAVKKDIESLPFH